MHLQFVVSPRSEYNACLQCSTPVQCCTTDASMRHAAGMGACVLAVNKCVAAVPPPLHNVDTMHSSRLLVWHTSHLTVSMHR